MGSAHWSSPEEVVDKDLAAGILRTADIFSRKQNCVEEHISLWIKHMLPVKNQPQSIQNQALLNWFREMKDKDYITEGEIAFKDFLGVDV
ncbi:hypothetical protein GCM10011348_18830 [Marinobacterium nitratireducens]|uniref:Uncharacterized protein n=1 Tax=Marinobacterium nitratireducens TaxID=518897 RepID=A0A918DRU0_9GAMM|nr:hypothetical protein GCM10011348_18830 [Marinobacterium nitratireducens]